MVALLLTIFTANAFAAELERGFNCSMSYRAEGASVAGIVYQAMWVGDGANFTDEYMGVHQVSINQIEKNLGESTAIYWKVEVRDEDSSVFLIESPDFKSFEFTTRVNVTPAEEEDPPTFKYLTIACDPTYFAG